MTSNKQAIQHAQNYKQDHLHQETNIPPIKEHIVVKNRPKMSPPTPVNVDLTSQPNTACVPHNG